MKFLVHRSSPFFQPCHSTQFCAFSRILPIFLILQISFVYSSFGDDKNGVAPNTISLPSGPGSIEGLGDSFQPMLNTGTARYGVNIVVPPGTAGHGPQLRLQYDSGYGSGPAGIGWKYGPGAISRQTDKGLPRYVDNNNGIDDDFDFTIDEPDEKDNFIGPDGEELVEVEDGVFRARIEGSFVRYRKVGESWEADLGNGTTLTFGSEAAAQISDATGTRIFKWLLEKSTDVNGNTIEYEYESFSGSDNQKYLREIRYGPGASPWPVFYFIYFSYEERPDWRVDYRSAFPVKTDRRLIDIHVGIQGANPPMCAAGDWNDDSLPDNLITKYELSYTLAQPNVSHLSKITRYGSDGISYLPPVSFAYSTIDLPQIISAAGNVITAKNAPVAVMDSVLVDLVDLNRDGLPDILRTDNEGANHVGYLNLGVNDEAVTREVTWASGQLVGSDDGLAPLLHLAEDRVSVADMDGDGLSDLVHTTDFGEVYYYRNTGELSWDDRKRMSILDQAPPGPFLFEDVETADLDFDKRIDVVQSTDSGYSIWFNVEEGKYSRRVHVSGPRFQGQVMRFSDSGVQTADLNGDRLSDITRITPTAVIYAPSMGYGNFGPAVSMPIPGTTLEDGENSQLSRAKLEDVNNDGLADLVVERAEANQLWCWLNRGTDSFTDRYAITNMPTQFSPSVAVRWTDMNGNTTTDLVYGDSTAAERIRFIDIGELLAGSDHANLLTGIKNGLGVTTSITYRSSTDHYLRDWALGYPWTTSVPFPVQVVTKVETTTGLDNDTVPGIDRYVKEYRYRDGYYEDREKQFRGFGEVQVIQWGDESAATRVSKNGFFTGGPDGTDNDGDLAIDEVSPEHHREEDALKGLVRFVEAGTATGKIFSREENSWLVRNLLVDPAGIEVRFAYNSETNNLIYEKTQNPETMRTTYVYDDFGNTTENRRYGALSINGDELFSFAEYINNTSNWIIGTTARSYQTGTDEVVIAEVRNYFDGPNFTGLGFGVLTKGQLTRQEGWVDGSTWVNLVRNAYDSYGNIISTMDPNGFLRSVTHDPFLHIFPEQETIEVGGTSPDLAITAAYNLGLGTVVSSLDFNNNEHRFSHDVFGRVTSIVRPGDSEALPSLAFAYGAADPDQGLLYSYGPDGTLSLSSVSPRPSSVMTRAREVSGEIGTLDTIGYVDGMGRALAAVEEAEDGFIVNGASLFNALGSVRYSYPPYGSSTPAYVKSTISDPAVETFYDALGRSIRVNNLPDADNVITSTSLSYLPLQNAMTDENNHTRRFYNDGQGLLVMVEEENGGEIYVTRYDYDPLGNLITITDAQDNIRSMEYDRLGRRTLLLDPDRGRMEYQYDAAGNLVQTVDNKSQIIVYTHDGVNRTVTEDFLDTGNITPDVSYHYDTPSQDYPAAENIRGRLSWLTDLSGGIFLSYDERGNTTWRVKRIDDDVTVSDYQGFLSYDALDRPVEAIYPDNSSITYRYNNRSLLDSIPGIIDSIDYHPSGQRSSITYSNGLTTSYEYDPRYRLSRLNTDFTMPTNSPVQDLSYHFDGVSNITAITDNRSIVSTLPENASQSFLYDGLDRLIRAEGPGYGRINYQYDRIGNMTFKSSPDVPDPLHISDPKVNLGVMTSGGALGTTGRDVKLPGSAPGPHAVTATASGLVFDYDDNGNMIDNDGDTYSWDFKDRLIESSAETVTAHYIYDHSGQRVIKKSSEHTSYYISKGYEIRDGKPVRYVFDDSSRVARIESAPQEGEPAEEAITFYPGWNFFSLTVEPDNPAVSAVLSPLIYTELWRYDQSPGQYEGYVPSENRYDFTEIHANRGYIVHVQEPIILLVSGTRSTGDVDLTAGWNFIPGFVELPTPVEQAMSGISGSYEQIWDFDAEGSRWRSYSPVQPPFLNDLLDIRPGSACWVKIAQPGQLSFQHQDAAVRFYHPDHLGSSSVITDMKGTVVERSEFYPFGSVRNEQRFGFESAYKFTGKERDRETGLNYFEARYYVTEIGRFISVDPLGSSLRYLSEKVIKEPQKLNFLAYAKSNPLTYTDPTGLDSKKATAWVLGLASWYLDKTTKPITEGQRLIGKTLGLPANPTLNELVDQVKGGKPKSIVPGFVKKKSLDTSDATKAAQHAYDTKQTYDSIVKLAAEGVTERMVNIRIVEEVLSTPQEIRSSVRQAEEVLDPHVKTQRALARLRMLTEHAMSRERTPAEIWEEEQALDDLYFDRYGEERPKQNMTPDDSLPSQEYTSSDPNQQPQESEP